MSRNIDRRNVYIYMFEIHTLYCGNSAFTLLKIAAYFRFPGIFNITRSPTKCMFIAIMCLIKKELYR